MSQSMPGGAGTSNPRRGALAVALAVVALVVIAFMAGRIYFTAGTGTGIETAAVTPAPDIGGAFELVDQNGRTVTDADFHGRYMLVYFGYTYCPDICPMSLTRNSEALEMLGAAGDQIVPVLITVDPDRDTVELLKGYADFFHPRLVALTGTSEQVARAAKAYRVYYAKVQEEGADADTYLMDHTSITYLMGPDGRYLRHFGHNVSAGRMAEVLREIR